MPEQNSNQDPINLSAANANYPVHTMESDLKNLGQNKAPEQNSGQPNNAAPQNINPKTEDTSPFFKQADWDKSAEEQKTASDSSEKKGLSRSIIWGVIIFAVLAVCAGGYYFWITRATVTEQPLQVLPEAPKVKPITFATDKPNYMVIGDENSPIKNTLNDYSQKVSETSITTPVEFVLTDSQNNNLTFQNFCKRAEINLPDSIAAMIKPSFSLYLYNDQGKMRVGIALSEISSENNLLPPEVLKEELNLARYFQPFFLESAQIPDDIMFSQSNYEGNTIKYVNLTANNDLSVDYTFKNGQWLIGTSKMTLRAMLDNIGKDYQPID